MPLIVPLIILVLLLSPSIYRVKLVGPTVYVALFSFFLMKEPQSTTKALLDLV